MANTRVISAAVKLDKEAEFNNAMKSINSNLRALKAEMQATDSAFRNQANSVEALRAKQQSLSNLYTQQKAKVDALKSALDALSAKGQENSAYADRLRTSYAKAQVDLNKFEDELKQTESALNEAEGSFDSAGTSAEGFGEKVGGTVGEMTDMTNAAETLKDAAQKMLDVLKECAGAATAFQSAMAGVSRTTGLTGSDLTEMGEAFKDLSTQIPVSTDELARIATTAGQLGIAANDVIDFTQIVAELAVVANVSSDSVATSMARIANLTQNSDFTAMADTIAVMGDATATTASRILEMAEGMASAGTNAGLSTAEIIGLSAAISSTGVEAGAGSTAISRLFMQLQSAVSTGEDLKEFAQVANMTAAEFKAAWGENAADALVAFINGLGNAKESGQDMMQVLSGLGITAQRELTTIRNLATAGDLLSSSLNMANAAWSEGTGLMTKYGVMAGTVEAKQTMAANAANNLKIAVGDALTPALDALYETATNVLEPITEFIQAHPQLIQNVTMFAGALATATAGLATYKALMLAISTVSLGAFAPMTAIAAVIATIASSVISANNAMNDMAADMMPQTESIDELEAELTRLESRYDELFEQMENGGDTNSQLREEFGAVSIACGELKTKIEELKAAEAEAEAEEAAHAIYLESTEGKCETLTNSLNELLKKYNEAYDAAFKSLSGQYGLFEKVDAVATKSTEDMLANMKSQADYYNSYAGNLQALKQLAGETAGLNEGLVEAISDGSKQSVEYAASIVAGYEDALKEGGTAAQDYISSLNEAYTAQQSALDAAASEMADLETNFTESWNKVIETAAQGAESCDQSAAMQTSALNTINGFIKGIDANEASLLARMTQLGQAATNAFNAALDINSPSKVMAESGRFTVEGFVQGIEANEFKAQKAMTDMAGASLNSFNGTILETSAVRNGLSAGTSVVINAQQIDDATIDYVIQKVNRELGGIT